MEEYRINQLDDLEEVNPIESKDYPGYYEIPLYPNYAISKDGVVIKTKVFDRERHLGRPLKTKVHNNYHRIGIIKDNKQDNRPIHRLVAMTFVGRPSRHQDKSLSELHVNHIDLNKLNNNYENLEWVTPGENVEHANKLGHIAKQVPVVVKNILTGQVRRIRNMEDCAREFGIPPTTFLNHLRAGNAGIVTKDWHVFKFDDGSAWKPIRPDRQVENAWYQISKWVAINKLTNQTIITDSSYDLAEALNVSADAILKLGQRNSAKLKDWDIQLKYMNITEEDKEQKAKALKDRLVAIKVKATCLLNGECKIFPSLKQCAEYFNDRVGALSWVIHRSNTKTKHGYKFELA